MMSLGDIEITPESVHDFLSKVDIADLFEVKGNIEDNVSPSDRHLENDQRCVKIEKKKFEGLRKRKGEK